jgi:hypothetical protein
MDGSSRSLSAKKWTNVPFESLARITKIVHVSWLQQEAPASANDSSVRGLRRCGPGYNIITGARGMYSPPSMAYNKSRSRTAMLASLCSTLKASVAWTNLQCRSTRHSQRSSWNIDKSNVEHPATFRLSWGEKPQDSMHTMCNKSKCPRAVFGPTVRVLHRTHDQVSSSLNFDFQQIVDWPYFDRPNDFQAHLCVQCDLDKMSWLIQRQTRSAELTWQHTVHFNAPVRRGQLYGRLHPQN